MSNVFIRKAGQEPLEVSQSQVAADILSGELLASDKVSLDGEFWVRLDQHKELGDLFKQRKAKQPPKVIPKVSEAEFYSSSRVHCPKCGFEQNRDSTCGNCNLIFEKYWHALNARTLKKSEQDEAPSPDEKESGGVFHKLLHGKYPLWKIYWLFGLVYPLVIILALMLAAGFKLQDTMINLISQYPNPNERMAEIMSVMLEEYKTYSLIFAVVLLVFLAYSLVVHIGLWRCARGYSGDSLWRTLSRIAVVLFFIILPISVFSIYSYYTGFDEQMSRYEFLFKQMLHSEISRAR